MLDITREDRELLIDAARAWVRQRAPTKLVREVRSNYADLGFDPTHFAEMSEMGWTGIVVPEEFGGHDFGFESLGMLVEELGRTLTPSPLIPSAVAAVSALLLGGTEEQKRVWLPRLASGDCIGSVAINDGPPRVANHAGVMARRDAESYILSGCHRPVPAGVAADILIVSAHFEGGPGDGSVLFLCSADLTGIDRQPLEELDVRGRAAIDFDNVVLNESNLLGEVGAGSAIARQVRDRTAAVAAAENLGAAVQAFETTMDYLKTRVQFDQRIGSFQALQHRAADLLAEIDLARAAVYAALIAIDRQDNEFPLLASIAKALSGKVFRKVAGEMIQMHGGIGMTDEHDAGLYFKRAQAAEVDWGNVAYHRERAARAMGL